LACATLGQALKDMRREGSPSRDDYISAVVWLGSMRATKFFDTAEISQEQALLAIGWSTCAEGLCRRRNGTLTPHQRRVLMESLRALRGRIPPSWVK
jgi:hypothetical protein